MVSASLEAVLSEYLHLEDNECLSLPPEAYLSESLYEHELERIFRHEWLCVGREEYIANSGDYFCTDLLGDPIIIVRADDGAVRALSSVCRHRYMPVAEGQGNTKRFVCPYHAWTYDLTGKLIAAPYMKGAKHFDASQCRLPKYRCESWCGFIFVNLDDNAKPLTHKMRVLDEHIANYRVADQVEIMTYNESWSGNWKLSAENSMEYYHHVGLHKDTVGGQMPAKLTYVPDAPSDLSFTHERCGMDVAYQSAGHVMNPQGNLDSFTEEELTTGYMVYIFPAFTMAMRPNANNWLSFRPRGVRETEVFGGYLVSSEVAEEFPDLAAQRRDLILKVNAEDSMATTELNKVITSTRAARGHLSPFEGTIAQFYRYLARTLTPAKQSQRSGLYSA